MTDQQTADPTATAASSHAAAATEAPTPEAIIGLVTDGAHALIVAQFNTMDEAQQAYEALTDLDERTSLHIDGVVVAACDADGKVTLGQVTDHSTKTGLKWGVVGGALLGLIFPPSIIGSAIALGGAGAVLGKVRNIFNRKGLADELAGVMQPNTAGLVALVQDTAVVAVRDAMARADRIVEKAIDEQLAAEIDREAAAAKQEASAG
jgi:uncharacterized membrane protein